MATHWHLGGLNKSFRQILVTDGWDISCEILLGQLSLDLTDNKSTLFSVMAWCCQVTSHYPNQCRKRSLMLYDIARLQWINFLIMQMSLMSDCYLHTQSHSHPFLCGSGNILSKNIFILPLTMTYVLIHCGMSGSNSTLSSQSYQMNTSGLARFSGYLQQKWYAHKEFLQCLCSCNQHQYCKILWPMGFWYSKLAIMLCVMKIVQ